MHTIKVTKARGLYQFIGLIGRRKIKPLFIKTRFGIHTFGLLHAIDVIVVDSYNKIVLKKENLKPGRIFIWPIIYNQIIELPVGYIDKYHLDVGDIININ